MTPRERLIHTAARCAHEAVRGYRESLGDWAGRTWNTADRATRDAAIGEIERYLADPDAPGEDMAALMFKAVTEVFRGPIRSADA